MIFKIFICICVIISVKNVVIGGKREDCTATANYVQCTNIFYLPLNKFQDNWENVAINNGVEFPFVEKGLKMFFF